MEDVPCRCNIRTRLRYVVWGCTSWNLCAASLEGDVLMVHFNIPPALHRRNVSFGHDWRRVNDDESIYKCCGCQISIYHGLLFCDSHRVYGGCRSVYLHATGIGIGGHSPSKYNESLLGHSRGSGGRRRHKWYSPVKLDLQYKSLPKLGAAICGSLVFFGILSVICCKPCRRWNVTKRRRVSLEHGDDDVEDNREELVITTNAPSADNFEISRSNGEFIHMQQKGSLSK